MDRSVRNRKIKGLKLDRAVKESFEELDGCTTEKPITEATYR